MNELRADEVRFVLKAISLPPEVQSRLSKASDTGLVLSDEEADSLLELVTDRLMTHGFDAGYRPTEEGEALERLVDRLSAGD